MRYAFRQRLMLIHPWQFPQEPCSPSSVDRCSVMQHLGVLEKAGLVIARREGRRRWNYFNPLPIRELHDRWISRYAGAAVDLLARMKRGIEK